MLHYISYQITEKKTRGWKNFFLYPAFILWDFVKNCKKQSGERGGAAMEKHLTERKSEKRRRLLFFIPLAFLAGVANGFFGAGGGMVLAVSLPFFLAEDEKDSLFAYVTLGVLLASAVSAAVYLADGRVSAAAVSERIFPALLGGGIGGLLLSRIDPALLKLLFSLIIIFSGVRFLWG